MILVLVSLALVRQPPLASRGGALPKITLSSAAFPLPPPERTSVAAGDSALDALLRAGRFEELLVRLADLPEGTARDQWIETCARLAPPELLAEHALRLPGASGERILSVALQRWAHDDPAKLGEWAARRLPDAPALDAALAGIVEGNYDVTSHEIGHIVESTDALHRPTATALELARLIRAPGLRCRAIRAALREWAASDPDAALRFAETDSAIPSDQRAGLLDLFTPAIPET